MTNEEFYELTRQASGKYPRVHEKALQELRKIYIKSIETVKAEVLKDKSLDLPELVRLLEESINPIAESLESSVISTINNSLELENMITYDFLKAAGVPGVTPDLFYKVNEKALKATINRTFQDGYTFSERVWKISETFKDDVIDVINLGMAQGKDNLKIAEALTTFVDVGKKGIKRPKVYGKIHRGNGKLYKRISKSVDWRALRLIRSEQYMSIQDAELERGRLNPACILYNWVKNSYTVHDCECADLAANSPYKEDEVPGFPHPNCMCTIEQVLMDHDKFIDDLSSWSKGGYVDYLDDWYLLTKTG